MASDTVPPSREDGGETIDLGGTLVTDVTVSGSYDLRHTQGTTVGKLLQVLPVPTLLINEMLRIVFANQSCEKFGWGGEGLRGGRLSSLFPGVSSASEIGDLVREVFLTRKTQIKEVTWKTDRKQQWGRLTVRPVRMKAERLALIMIEDLTAEREQVEQALKQKEHLAQVNLRLSETINAKMAADEAARQSEDRYRHLVETANDAIYATDADGRFTFVNAVTGKICGYSESEMIGKHYLDVIHPSYKQQVERFYGIQFVKRLPNTYYEVPILAKSGETRWMGQSVQLIMEGDSVVGFQAVARDITERREAEEALRDREQLLSTVLAASPVGVGLTIDRRMVWANEALVSMFGFAEEKEYAGKSLRMLYPSDEEFERVGRLVYRDLATGKTNEVEARMRRKHGSLFDAAVRLRPVDPLDPSKGHIAAVTDVTERKRVEELVRQSKETLEAVVNATTDVVVLVGKDDTVRLVNTAGADTLGSTPGEMIGRNVDDYLPSDVALRRKKSFARVIETGEPVKFEDERNGVRFDFVLAPVFGSVGRVDAVVSFARDITERIKAETERKESEESSDYL